MRNFTIALAFILPLALAGPAFADRSSGVEVVEQVLRAGAEVLGAVAVIQGRHGGYHGGYRHGGHHRARLYWSCNHGVCGYFPAGHYAYRGHGGHGGHRGHRGHGGCGH